MDSILNTVKKHVGIQPDYKHFDDELILSINTALSVLFQLGFGSRAFSITGEKETWGELFALEEADNIELVKTYICMKVQMIFDTPSGSKQSAYDSILAELENRIYLETDDTWEKGKSWSEYLKEVKENVRT